MITDYFCVCAHMCSDYNTLLDLKFKAGTSLICLKNRYQTKCEGKMIVSKVAKIGDEFIERDISSCRAGFLTVSV